MLEIAVIKELITNVKICLIKCNTTYQYRLIIHGLINCVNYIYLHKHNFCCILRVIYDQFCLGRCVNN